MRAFVIKIRRETGFELRPTRCGFFRPFCFFFCSLFIPLSVLSGCGIFDQDSTGVVLQVGSKRVTLAELKKDVKYISAGMDLSGQDWKEMRDELVQGVVDHYLILEYGKAEGISVSDDEFRRALLDIKKDYADNAFEESVLRGYVDLEEWKHRLREQLLLTKIMDRVTKDVPSPSYQDIKTYFDANQDEFRTAQAVHFRQILVRTKAEGEDILKRLKGGEPFGELAREFSIAPEAEDGGEVGWVAKDQLEPSMEKALFSLPVGKLSSVTKTPYGYHIFQVISSRPEGIRGLAEVMEDIEASILRERREAFAKTWLEGLRNRFQVKINMDLLEKTELS
jgi:peptidyl-prolyl cis-trans isomerase C